MFTLKYNVKQIGYVIKKVLIDKLFTSKRVDIENLDYYKIFNSKCSINLEILKNKSLKQLEIELKKQKKIYKDLKFIHHTFFYKNPMKLRITRKLIAQIYTILRYKKTYETNSKKS